MILYSRRPRGCGCGCNGDCERGDMCWIVFHGIDDPR